VKTIESTRIGAVATAARDSGATLDAGVMSGRVLELDALRGLACLAILFHHFKPHLLPFGWAAVDLFFVLSGYLITAIILKNGRQKHFLYHFYMRRGLRIWPIYYLTVLTIAAVSPWLPRAYDYAGLPYILTYTQEVGLHWSQAAPAFSEYLMHTWSLAVEEQFYLIWPVLVCLVGRRGVVPLALALAAAAVCARSSGMYWRVLLTRSDGLALGALLAALFTGPKAIREHSALPKVFAGFGLASLAYLAVLIGSGAMAKPEAPPWPGLSMLVVNTLCAAVVGLVIYFQGRPALGVLRRPRLVKIGQLSYGLYIYHYVFMLLSDDLAGALGLGGRPFWREALTLAVIFVVASLSWRYVEMPLLRLKDRFEYRPTPRAETSRPHFSA
jgi:peptidoglycan/LPS O-acetylase OafA/YrhL